MRETGQLYRERLDLLADAESQGFDIYHVAEHHGTPLGLVPSPSVFLAAAAMRTTRIRLCPLVYVLPHIIRRAWRKRSRCSISSAGAVWRSGSERAVTLYQLLSYGIDRGEAHKCYDQAFELVLRALESGTIGAQGVGAAAADMSVLTRQAPYPPIWYPSSNPASVPGLGKRGINTILGFSFRSPTVEETRLRRDEYFDGVADAPSGIPMGGAGVRSPRFGIMRNVYVGESDRDARERMVQAMEVFYEQFTALWRRHGDHRGAEPVRFRPRHRRRPGDRRVGGHRAHATCADPA